MSAPDRRHLGQLTIAEAHQRWERGQERDFKALVVNWLNLHGAYLFTQGMNKRTRGKRGTPDILACYRGIFLAIELKATGETLSVEQAGEFVRIRNARGACCLAFCLADVMDSTSMIDQELSSAIRRPNWDGSRPALEDKA